ncbi:LysR family transcriptional regulator [Mesobacillus maritimus]|uniref:LysR family transcriptional regulator n=1 Tax=Mesobacillus maritimus TaxID=1643336 RepID=UPI002041FCEF|nr:LysR family transcriptional regulator [Mesobacillus maritimus]MCM3672175.1 LysR family transcriptional regulator [Mesobacillus maritimus]
MELKHLQYFTEVVKHGSFSKAAESLYISQPNISNVIKDLEEELEVKLLIRTTRKLELTDTGRLLYQYGQQVSQTLQQFYQELDDTKNSKKGSVKMGIFPMLGTEFFTNMIANFHLQYPEIRVRFVEDGARKLRESLLQGDLDLVVMPYPIDEKVYDFFPFLSGELRILVHQQHPLANKSSVKWGELVDENFIIFREGFTIHDTIIEECGRLGFEPKIICETSQWNFMIEMVSNHQGITILPQSKFNEIDSQHHKLKVLPLVDPEKEWNLGIAWRKESYLSFATRTWIQFLKETLES